MARLPGIPSLPGFPASPPECCHVFKAVVLFIQRIQPGSHISEFAVCEIQGEGTAAGQAAVAHASAGIGRNIPADARDSQQGGYPGSGSCRSSMN